MHPCLCSVPPPPSTVPGHPPLPPLMADKPCTSMRDLRALHSHLIKTGLASDTISVNRVLAFCATAPAGDIDYALQVFSRIAYPNAYTWNTILRGISRSSTPRLALEVFVDMLRSPTPPQRLTFPSLFTAAAHLGPAGAEAGAQLHAMAVKLELAEDPYVRNSMLSMYGSCGQLASASRLFDRVGCFDVVAANSMIMALMRKGLAEDARQLFDDMPQRSLPTWSTMMSGYVRNGMFEEAVGLFGEMQQAGIEPNACVLVSLLGACAGLGAVEQGEWALAFIKRRGIQVNSMVLNAVIDMYCKCGRLEKALKMFDDMPKRALSSWNCMISGLAMHGQWEEAVRLFSRLQALGLKPDNATFVGILAACSHAGMVDEAQQYFSMMVDSHCIKPTIEHYGCLVDVLGRAGRLEEAEDLISKMPMEPDTAVWGSLLAACRSYGNVEMGARAAKEIMELDPGDSGGYLILANVYAGMGEYRESINVRGLMRERRVRKKPGCSMIEVDGVVHEFVAGGTLHPQANEIDALLKHLVMNTEEMDHLEFDAADTTGVVA